MTVHAHEGQIARALVDNASDIPQVWLGGKGPIGMQGQFLGHPYSSASATWVGQLARVGAPAKGCTRPSRGQRLAWSTPAQIPKNRGRQGMRCIWPRKTLVSW